MLRRFLQTEPTRQPDRQVMEIEQGPHRVPVILRESSRARRIGLRLGQKAEAFVLTRPSHASEAEALRFAREHTGWMQARLARLPRRIPFAPGEVIPLRGHPHRLEKEDRLRGLVWPTQDENGAALIVPGLPDHFSRKVADYLKAEAKKDLNKAVSHYCAAIAVEARRVSLRDPATRWGSCSTSGTLSFSWRLIMAPDHVLDYLAAHEVTHIRHMNHGHGFWRLLRDICPHTDQAEHWLKRHGRSLHAYGAQT